ncbi:hypothetical protein ES702_00128 [subsurface metagenome]
MYTQIPPTQPPSPLPRQPSTKPAHKPNIRLQQLFPRIPTFRRMPLCLRRHNLTGMYRKRLQSILAVVVHHALNKPIHRDFTDIIRDRRELAGRKLTRQTRNRDKRADRTRVLL